MYTNLLQLITHRVEETQEELTI